MEVYDCTFNTQGDSVLLRRDTKEIIPLKKGETIKTGGYEKKGYDIINVDEVNDV